MTPQQALAIYRNNILATLQYSNEQKNVRSKERNKPAS